MCRDLKITKHAIKRCKERFGISEELEIIKLARRALNNGLDVTSNSVLRHVIAEKMKKYKSPIVYIDRNIAFVFQDNYVVTVYPAKWLFDFSEAS